ncbi:MAG TPA: hypothetical protein VGV61_08185 [Thermoanaerobaculia bacterium]|jgi:hypothetical protein|nr:hypothetical protein [Thermoanaerobaculia bacterium]
MRHHCPPLVPAMVALALLACSRNGGPPRRPPLPPGEAEEGGPAFLAPVLAVDHAAPGTAPAATLVAVRTGTHGEFDRLVLELAGELPGYRVAWTKARPHQCASGQPAAVAGSAWLEVRLDPAQAHDAQGRLTVARRSEPGLPAVAGVTLTCDFEGVVSWAVGSGARRPFRVLSLSDPPRLVIDLAHAAAPGGPR